MMTAKNNPIQLVLLFLLLCFMGGGGHNYFLFQCTSSCYGFTANAPRIVISHRRRLINNNSNNNKNNLPQSSIVGSSTRSLLTGTTFVAQKMLPFDHHHDIVVVATAATTTTSTSSPSLTSTSSSFLTAVIEVFDGSDIVDPVVVSNVFWTSLKGKIISIIIGQILATIVFGLLASFAASKLSQAGRDYIIEKTTTTTTIEKQQQNQNQNKKQKQFIKANETVIINPDYSKLFICLAIDIIGTELIPILGEATDIIYAPIAGYILRSLYGSNNILFVLEFTEEILPFTDVLPLATICWVVDTFFGESDIARVLQLGEYNNNRSSSSSSSSTRMILPDDDSNKNN